MENLEDDLGDPLDTDSQVSEVCESDSDTSGHFEESDSDDLSIREYEDDPEDSTSEFSDDMSIGEYEEQDEEPDEEDEDDDEVQKAIHERSPQRKDDLKEAVLRDFGDDFDFPWASDSDCEEEGDVLCGGPRQQTKLRKTNLDFTPSLSSKGMSCSCDNVAYKWIQEGDCFVKKCRRCAKKGDSPFRSFFWALIVSNPTSTLFSPEGSQNQGLVTCKREGGEIYD